MSHQVVTWKKIADQANELYPKALRSHYAKKNQYNQDDKIDYIAAAVVQKPAVESDDSLDDHQNTSATNPLFKRLEKAYTKIVDKKATQHNVPRLHIFDEFRMSRGKLDISRLVKDKDDL